MTASEAMKARLVTELADFLDQWQTALARQALPTDRAVVVLQRRALELGSHASSAGLGGLTHHLGRCHTAVETRDFAALTQSLEAVRDLQRHVSAELSAAAQSGERFRGGQRQQSSVNLSPPPMLTVDPSAPRAISAAAPQIMPTLLSESAVSQQSKPQDRRPSAPPEVVVAPAVPALAAPVPAVPPAPNLDTGTAGNPVVPPVISSPGAPPRTAPEPEPQLGGAAHAFVPPVSAVARPVVHAGAPVAPEKAPMSKPQLLVRSMFGLRAFGRNKKAPSPRIDAGGSSPSLLGLKSRRNSEPAMSAVQPRFLANDPSGLPRLSERSSDVSAAPAARPNVNQVLGRIGNPTPRPRAHAASNPSARPRRSTRPNPRATQGSGAGWIIFGSATVGVGVLAMVGFLVFGRRQAPETDQREQIASAPTTSASGDPLANVALPRSKLTSPTDQLKSLMVRINGRKLSPELRAYVDEDAASVAKALKSDCKEGKASEVCAELQETFVDQKPLQIKKRRRDPNRTTAGWMRGLKMPAIPVEDDERVKRQFEFYTQNPVGRETFQAMLFRCGAYKDLIHSELVKYELPTDVMAVVFAESSCFIRAESPAGAIGLWQFIPASARAYHLRVKEGVVDERLSPVKSTRAGVRYMADMYALFGEWDLVFASYNMGPFGLMARLERAGGNDVSFWDLVDAKLLPEETEHYAPAIQALALIMNNLRRLKFSTSQMKAPQLTADLDAPAGTRLGMVARAAAMSAAELRKLNPDLVGENVPNLPGGFSVQVPKDVVWQARDTLKELLAQRDDADLCVSPAFDWGRRQFTTSMAEACHRKLQARQTAEQPEQAPAAQSPPVAPTPESDP